MELIGWLSLLVMCIIGYTSGKSYVLLLPQSKPSHLQAPNDIVLPPVVVSQNQKTKQVKKYAFIYDEPKRSVEIAEDPYQF